MNTLHEYQGEPERREGLGGRGRRYEPPQAHDPDQAMYSEPADSYTGDAGYPDRPATTAPYDAEPDTKLAPTGSEEFRGQSSDQLAAAASAARVGLLNDVGSLRDEWQRVQGTFVDDPQRAVREASALVERTLEEIRTNVGSHRPSEGSGETMSTEDLRVSFQRYREFFQRLLAA